MTAIVALLGGWRATAFAAALLLALSFAGLQSVRLAHANTKAAEAASAADRAAAASAVAQVMAVEAMRQEEHARAKAVNAVAEAYERGKSDAKREGDRVAADLRSGGLRFKRMWQECTADAAPGVPGLAADSGEPAGASAGRARSAGRVVRAVEHDAAQIRCLQALALTDRGIDPGDLSQGCPAQ